MLCTDDANSYKRQFTAARLRRMCKIKTSIEIESRYG